MCKICGIVLCPACDFGFPLAFPVHVLWFVRTHCPGGPVALRSTGAMALVLDVAMLCGQMVCVSTHMSART